METRLMQHSEQKYKTKKTNIQKSRDKLLFFFRVKKKTNIKKATTNSEMKKKWNRKNDSERSGKMTISKKPKNENVKFSRKNDKVKLIRSKIQFLKDMRNLFAL